MLPYDNDILSIPSIIRSLKLTEHKEDVNECTHDPIIVKTNVCSFKYVTRNQLYINSHTNHDKSNINTCIRTIQSHIDYIHLNKIQSAKQSSITKYF